MNFKHIFLTLLVTLIVFGCNKDEITKENQLDNIAEYELQVEKAMAEIEADYQQLKHPSVEESGARTTYYLEADSEDALQDLIDQALSHSKIVIRSGDHYESSTVLITKRLRIVGEPGAVIYFDNVADRDWENAPIETHSCFYVKDVYNVRIEELEIRPKEGEGNMAIFIDNAPKTRIIENTILGFFYPIWVHNNSHRISIYKNVITGLAGISEFEENGDTGITMESGDQARIMGNDISFYDTGLFLSDRKGIALANKMLNGAIGILFCTVQGPVVLPNGQLLENAESCNDWLVAHNRASGFLWSYLIIDGAHHNLSFQNASSDAILYDVEAVGDSYRFGFLTPTSHHNNIISVGHYSDLSIKVCGENNRAIGGDQVDTNVDECN